MIIQTKKSLSNRTHSLKNRRSTKSDCKDIEMRKSEFVAKTQFLSTNGLCKITNSQSEAGKFEILRAIL